MSPSDPHIAQALQQAIEHHSAGRLREAEQLYRGILQSEPRHPEANYNLGGLAMEAGQPAIGLPHLQAALEADPTQAIYWLSFAEALLIAGNAEGARGVIAQAMQRGLSGPAVDQLMAQIQKAQPGKAAPADSGSLYAAALQHHKADRLADAVMLYQQFIAVQPKHAEAQNNLGVALQAMGRLDEAVESYRRALAVKKTFDKALNNLGNALKDQGKLEEAAEYYRKALALTPKSSEIHYNLGNVLKDIGKKGEAANAYRRAAGITPDFVWAHNNLGGLLVEQGKPDEAILSIRRALALKPDFAEAHNNLGNALKDQGKRDDAMAAYRQAIAAKPDYAEAHLHLGNVLCDSGRIEEGFAACTRAAELTYANPKAEAAAPPHKIQHDREQRDYLSAQGVMAGDRLRLADGERLTTPAVNPDNRIADIAEQWRHNKPQVVVIDNLLTDAALTKLRRFCWGSTMWRRVYQDGYLGAFPESGFTAPLIAQIGEELRETYPAIFGGHPLLYAWAFKYDSQLRGIRLHADFAAVNVNFWITPDEANLDPASGGLVVWDKAAPLDWDFAKFNSIDTTHARDFLEKAAAKPTTIPYRANRAVIFDSDLFHETDRIAFKDGYQNRRINVTLLYGRRASS